MSREIKALLKMGRLLREAESTEAALAAVSETALSLTGSTQATVRLLDKGGRELLVAARIGEAMHVGGAACFRAGEGLIGWSAKNGKAALVNDAPHDERFQVKEGQLWMPSGVLAAPLLFGESEVIGVLSTARSDGPDYVASDLALLELIAEVAARHVQVARLRALAETDCLTLLYNRHHLEKRFLAEKELSLRHGRPLSAILLDLDHFSNINNDYSHPIGDEVLIEVAKRLREACRLSDVLLRWGGEEFLLLLPETDGVEALAVARRVLAALSDTPVETRAGPLTLTGSAGVAAVHPLDDLLSLLERVDGRLRAAKDDGRNRIAAGPLRPTDWNEISEDTWADWRPVDRAPARPPDFKSASGSIYWDTGDGVYRSSNHWGAHTHTCSWMMEGEESRELTVGYCAYADFRRRPRAEHLLQVC